MTKVRSNAVNDNQSNLGEEGGLGGGGVREEGEGGGRVREGWGRVREGWGGVIGRRGQGEVKGGGG